MGNTFEFDESALNPSQQERIPVKVPDFEGLQDRLGIFSAADLNKIIQNGDVKEMVVAHSELHDIAIDTIAQTIASDRERKKALLIAGPSSSGKTTFAKKLDLALYANGLSTVTISLDNYFMERGMAPKHYDGSDNLEALEAIDYKLFNKNLADLIEGAEVELPRYSFKTASRLPEGIKMQLKADQIIVVEGIHALNPRLTSLVDEESKIKIYISPLSVVQYDSSPISPTDVRFLRRLVRDYKFRSSSAANTFRMWPLVIEGELVNILPFMNTANFIFNSSIIYELCILKKHALPLLCEIDKGSDKYQKAQELATILEHFTDMDDALVMNNSLLREFIGGSVFKY